ncbi:MAG: hypothetical protein JSW73_04720 [Candidatus Woesearchaeota archaeon]|nr:MAG: hypothetical protein JSW73_04720 [Candidatus Woesearchaeota archaeon]
MKLYDICIPKNNEKELIEIAKELGYSGIVFLYPPKKTKEVKSGDFEVYTGLLVKGKNISKIKKKDLGENIIVAQGDGSEEVNRAILSNKNVDIIIDVSSAKGKEHTHYRKSTLNQVLAKQALKSKITYAINFNRILNEKERIKLIGRVKQNIQIFQKSKVTIIICSFATNKNELRNYSDLVSFARTLGAKKVNPVEEIIRKKIDPNFISEGVRVINS